MSAPVKPTVAGMYVTERATPTQSRPSEPTPTGLRSVVFRLSREKNDALDALAKDTRIRKSEYVREAIADLLAKHGEELDVKP